MPPKRKAPATSTGGNPKSAKVDDAEPVTTDGEEGKETTVEVDTGKESSKRGGKMLKIVSFNVNGVRAWLKVGEEDNNELYDVCIVQKDGLKFVRAMQPDMMMMQEMKCSKADMPPELKMLTGYHVYTQDTTQGNKGYAGVGLLTKTKPLSVSYGLGKAAHDGEGRIITAEFDDFFLIGAYVPNSGRGLVRLPYRATWDADLKEYIKEKDKLKPVVYCGDLNVAHNEIDLKNPKSNRNKTAGFTDQEREAFTDLLSAGFTDSFRHLHPKAVEYSYWSYMMNSRAKNTGWRLDYFVVSDRLMENVEESSIEADVMGSDHCPIVLSLTV